MVDQAIRYQSRRARLAALIKQRFPDKKGLVVLASAYEHPRYPFWQDSTWRYFVGLEEPGAIMIMTLEGEATLYLPTYTTDRSAWMSHVITPTDETARAWGLADFRALGQPVVGYHIAPLFSRSAHEQILSDVTALLQSGGVLFAPLSDRTDAYLGQRMLFERWQQWLPPFGGQSVDIGDLVGRLRRTKDPHEITLMARAGTITAAAHTAVARTIRDGVSEAAVEAALTASMIAQGAQHAFPPIIASGIRGTILHYHDNNELMRDGDLVVIDTGASVDGYAADVSRTYPVSGRFTKRQRELYDMVLATQTLVAEKARPGIWLRNAEKPEQSLQHIAMNHLKQYGLDTYFCHGIGHFLGLDVHDVGNAAEPLAEGDVITIEPGLYIRAEQIGIRIEDDFLIERDGVRCLTDELPRTADAVEQMVSCS